MKTKNLISAILLATILSFTGCSEDDPSNESSGIHVKTITFKYDYAVRTESYTYSNGKLSKYRAWYDYGGELEFDQTIIYKGNTVTLTGSHGGNECEQIYTLSNGLATSCKLINKEEEWEEDYTFQYSNGYLTGISLVNDIGRTHTSTFEYSNGNITRASYNDGYYYENRTYTFTYNDTPNKGGVINPVFLDKFESFFLPNTAAYYAGILGKPTKNLIIRAETSNKHSEYVHAIGDNDCVKMTNCSNGDIWGYIYE